MRFLWRAFLLAGVAIMAVCAAGPALAAEPPLAFVATTPVLTFGASSASVSVVLQNDAATCQKAIFSLVILPFSQPSTPTKAPGCVPPGTTVIALKFKRSFSTAMTSGVLTIVGVGPPGASQAIVLSLRRSVGGWAAGLLPLLAGLTLALITLAGTRLWLRRGYEKWVKASSSWSFKDSWATNITAVGALLGTILSAVGSASTIVPGIQTDRFAVLSAAWGGLAIIAPLLIAFQGRHTDGMPANGTAVIARTSMMFAAALLTLTAVGGELTTVGVLLHFSTASGTQRELGYAVLIASAVLVSLYAAVTTKTLISSQKDEHHPRSALSKFDDTALAL